MPTEVQVEFLNQGGNQNLSVNGRQINIGRLSAAPHSLAGVSIAVFMSPTSAGSASKGVVILRGPVKEVNG